jgi:hypothetical protein
MPDSHAIMRTQLPCHKVLAENCVCRALRLLKVTGTSRLRGASSSGISGKRKFARASRRQAAGRLPLPCNLGVGQVAFWDFPGYMQPNLVDALD